MRHLVIAAAALSAMTLAGCQTIGAPAPGTGPISSGTGLAAEIVTGVQEACSLPVAKQTVDEILASKDAIGATARGVIDGICAGVAPLASGPGLEGVHQGYAFGVRIRAAAAAIVGHRRRR